jgi:hypothetical protein
MTQIINKEEEILVTAQGGRRDRATKVTVDQLEDGFGTPMCLTRKRCPSLFANEATVAHLINMIKCRQATHHVLAGELTQRVEVEMIEARVPEPRRLICVHHHSHRTPNMQREVVEPGPVSFHLV